MKKHILFVDDEKNILQGLERSLRGQRNAWKMEFVASGQAALQRLDEEHFDALVTDMRMPGMDGAQLLEQVSREHSELIRIILSGHSDDKMIIQSVGTAHQFLAKPCDIGSLKETLNRAFDLKAFLSEEKLQSVVTGLSKLPSKPQTYQAIMTKLRSPDVTLREVGAVIATDPSMTAKILQLVNSAFFGLGRRVSSTEEAATLLGLDTIKSLTLSFGIFSQFDQKLIKDCGFSIEALWQHSLAVAKLAKQIARSEKADKDTMDDCFLAGLLHDIGILILVQNYSEDYARVRTLVDHHVGDLYQMENQVFGTTHSAVGAFLLGIWGLAAPVVEGVAFHHQPAISIANNFCPLTAVHAAEVLTCQEDESEDHSVYACQEVDQAYLERIGLKDRYGRWAELQ
jgi:putative nucleotidyltransferase with HDIG domain